MAALPLWGQQEGWLRMGPGSEFLDTVIGIPDSGELASELPARSLREPGKNLHEPSTLVTGNDVPDVHLVTLMRQHGVRRIYSRDRGLRRFPEIDVVDPFAAPPTGGRQSRSTGR